MSAWIAPFPSGAAAAPDGPRPATDARPDARPDVRGEAWRREMERAQAQAWFPGARPPAPGLPWTPRETGQSTAGTAPASARAGVAPLRPAEPVTPGAIVWAARRPATPLTGPDTSAAPHPASAMAWSARLPAHEATTPTATEIAITPAEPNPPAPAGTAAALPGLPPAPWAGPAAAAPSAFAERQADPDPATASPARHAAQAHAARPPATARVQMHAAPGPDGLSVWLGIAGDGATGAQAQPLLPALRRALQAVSLPLARVVCNGRTVYERVPALTPHPHPHPQED